MPNNEYMWDPSQNAAVEVSRGGREEVNPDAPTPEEIEGAIHNRMARGLTQRANNVSKASAGDTNMLAAETKLLELQAAISRETNPLKIEQMQAKAEALASGLVGGPMEPLKAPIEPKQQSKDDWMADYRNTNPGVEQDLAYAGEVFGSELAPAFQEMIDSDDEQTRVGAIRTIAHLRKSPASFVSAEESTGVSEDMERHIAASYGEATANAIAVLGNNLAQGLITSKQAISTASKDPVLLNALYTLASDPSNNFKIAL